jgi:hypothetical protein
MLNAFHDAFLQPDPYYRSILGLQRIGWDDWRCYLEKDVTVSQPILMKVISHISFNGLGKTSKNKLSNIAVSRLGIESATSDNSTTMLSMKGGTKYSCCPESLMKIM